MDANSAILLVWAGQLITILLPAFFWIRGIFKKSKSYLIVGFAALCLSFPAVMILYIGSSKGIGAFSINLLVFGLVTFIASAFAKPDCPVKRKELHAIAMGCVIAALCCSVII